MSILGIVGTAIYFALMVMLIRRLRAKRGRLSPGPAAVGAFYEMLSTDKRRAIQVIVEDRAAACDPEDADGNLPDLAGPRNPTDSH